MHARKYGGDALGTAVRAKAKAKLSFAKVFLWYMRSAVACSPSLLFLP